jgi:hypothetical protein
MIGQHVLATMVGFEDVEERTAPGGQERGRALDRGGSGAVPQE